MNTEATASGHFDDNEDQNVPVSHHEHVPLANANHFSTK